jgi:hypothetical protein
MQPYREGAEMRRHAVQIAAATPGEEVVYALCDDETIWAICPSWVDPVWWRLPDIPLSEDEGVRAGSDEEAARIKTPAGEG